MTFVHRTRLLRRRFASGLSLLGARGQAVGMRDEMGVCAALSNTGYWPKYRLRDRLLGRIRNEAARSIVLSSKTQRTTTKGVEIVRYGGYATFAPVTLPAPMAWLTMAPVPVPAALSAVLRPVLSCPAVLLSCCPTICPIPIPEVDEILIVTASGKMLQQHRSGASRFGRARREPFRPGS